MARPQHPSNPLTKTTTRRGFVRTVGLGAALGAVTPLLQACGSGSSDEVTLTYWTHQYDPAIAVNKRLIKEYQKKNPGVRITYDYVPHANYEQKLFTALAGGSGPDVFWAGDWLVPQFLENNVLAPVDYAAYGVESKDEFLALFEPGSLDPYVKGDEVFTGGLSEYEVFSLFYHPQHLAEAGLPETLPDEPVTWEKLAQYAGKMAKTKGGKRVRDGIEWEVNNNVWSVLIIEPMVRQLGGELFDEKAGKPLFTSPEVTEVLQFLQDLGGKHQAIDPGFYTPNSVTQFFAEERVSMNIAGPYQPSLIEDTNPKAEYQAAPLPVFSGGDRTTTMYSWAWFVNAQADEGKQRAAWEFVEFLTSQGKLWWDEVRYPQARKGKTKGGEDINEYRKKTSPSYAVALADYEYGRYQFRSTDYYKIASALQRAQSRVLQGQDVAAVLQKAQREAES